MLELRAEGQSQNSEATLWHIDEGLVPTDKLKLYPWPFPALLYFVRYAGCSLLGGCNPELFSFWRGTAADYVWNDKEPC